jgi:hypothetical protein
VHPDDAERYWARRRSSPPTQRATRINTEFSGAAARFAGWKLMGFLTLRVTGAGDRLCPPSAPFRTLPNARSARRRSAFSWRTCSASCLDRQGDCHPNSRGFQRALLRAHPRAFGDSEPSRPERMGWRRNRGPGSRPGRARTLRRPRWFWYRHGRPKAALDAGSRARNRARTPRAGHQRW